jgi:hypothetical protein
LTDRRSEPPAERGAAEGARSGASLRIRSAVRDVGVALRDPVVSILILAAFFDGISGNPPHAIVLSAVAVALGREAVVRRRAAAGADASPRVVGGDETALLASLGDDAGARARRLVLVPLAFVAIVAYATVVGGFARYSWPATIGVVVPATAVLLVSWRGPLRPGPEPASIGTVGAVAWLTVFVGLCLWELVELLLQPTPTTDSYAHPTLSVLSDPILATHPGRTIGLVLWALLGWFLLRR